MFGTVQAAVGQTPYSVQAGPETSSSKILLS